MEHKITCKDCKSRYLGCHEECPDYMAFRHERDELNNLRHENKRKEFVIDEYRIQTQNKYEKRNSYRRNK